jgi:multiple sugar transport system permease protein
MKTRATSTIRPIVNHTALYIVTAIYVLPIVWMISNSLKSAAQARNPSLEIFTTSPRFANYKEAWDFTAFDTFIKNGLIVSVAGTVISVVVSILAGYAFARLEFPGRDKLFVVFLATLMVPQEVVLVPLFILMRDIGWIDSYKALILPWAFTAFGTFLLRQFFLTVPRELERAAFMDGAGRLKTLFYVMVPIARPAIAVLAIFQFIYYWNSFLWPLIIVRGKEKATVPIGLNFFLAQNGNQWHYLMAAAAISMIPTTLLVIALSRHLVRGVAVTGFGGR